MLLISNLGTCLISSPDLFFVINDLKKSYDLKDLDM